MSNLITICFFLIGLVFILLMTRGDRRGLRCNSGGGISNNDIDKILASDDNYVLVLLNDGDRVRLSRRYFDKITALTPEEESIHRRQELSQETLSSPPPLPPTARIPVGSIVEYDGTTWSVLEFTNGTYWLQNQDGSEAIESVEEEDDVLTLLHSPISAEAVTPGSPLRCRAVSPESLRRCRAAAAHIPDPSRWPRMAEIVPEEQIISNPKDLDPVIVVVDSICRSGNIVERTKDGLWTIRFVFPDRTVSIVPGFEIDQLFSQQEEGVMCIELPDADNNIYYDAIIESLNMHITIPNQMRPGMDLHPETVHMTWRRTSDKLISKTGRSLVDFDDLMKATSVTGVDINKALKRLLQTFIESLQDYKAKGRGFNSREFVEVQYNNLKRMIIHFIGTIPKEYKDNNTGLINAINRYY